MTKKLIAYLRVSTDDKVKSGGEEALRLGIEAQRTAIRHFAATKGYEILEEVEERASGKLNLEARPVLNEAVKRASKLGATLVVSKLDRLSRDVEFIAGFVKRIDFICVALGENADRMTMHFFATIAENERAQISDRTKAALAALKVSGVQLGFAKHKDPEAITKARAKGAAVNASKADDFAAHMKATVSALKERGMSFKAIADELNRMHIKTARGKAWATQTVINVYNRMEA